MKLILTQEVDGLGAPGDVVEVKDGYGRNYLVPRGLGIRWPRGGEKTIEPIKSARTARAARDEDHAKEIKAKLEGLRVSLKTRAGEGGRLFGSVTSNDVVGAVKAAGGPILDKRSVEMPGHIKTTGGHKVTVKIHQGVTASLVVDVVAS